MKKMVLEQRIITEYNAEIHEMDELIRYDVKKVVNSTSPKIGDRLIPLNVNGYCEDVEWTVEITGVK